MASKLRETIFCVIETKFYKAVQARFRRKFNLSTCPGKPQVFLWYRNFQTYETVNKRSKKSENPFSERKLNARSVDKWKRPPFCLPLPEKVHSISRSSLQRILTSTLSADLALNFLPLDGFSGYLLHLFIVSYA